HKKAGVPEYAQKIVSSKHQQDGLYWPAEKGAPVCPVPKGFAKAAAGMAAAEREPYHGYFFRVLTSQGTDAAGGAVNYIINGQMIGGFALIAWPAEYGASGIQTFIVNHDGAVFEKTLGPDTAKTVGQITAFDPDKTWRPVQPDTD
ncbi:MAG TPA: DUF2950 family protein, partial [Elusimicrobiota bacterium]|nr:DUF2950 family protein [Elusimicrobiota bacterium]